MQSSADLSGDLFTGRIPGVRVHICQREIPSELVRGDYQNDPAARERVQAWINAVWIEKDERLWRALAGEDSENRLI